MSLEFRLINGAAENELYRITIPSPRLEKGIEIGEMELQYTVRHGVELQRIGLAGHIETVGADGDRHQEWLIKVDALAVLSILQIKAAVGDSMADFDFVCDFSKGLIVPFADGWDLMMPTRYSVCIAAEAVVSSGIKLPNDLEHSGSGPITLARLTTKPSRELQIGASL